MREDPPLFVLPNFPSFGPFITIPYLLVPIFIHYISIHFCILPLFTSIHLYIYSLFIYLKKIFVEPKVPLTHLPPAEARTGQITRPVAWPGVPDTWPPARLEPWQLSPVLGATNKTRAAL